MININLSHKIVYIFINLIIFIYAKKIVYISINLIIFMLMTFKKKKKLLEVWEIRFLGYYFCSIWMFLLIMSLTFCSIYKAFATRISSIYCNFTQNVLTLISSFYFKICLGISNFVYSALNSSYLRKFARFNGVIAGMIMKVINLLNHSGWDFFFYYRFIW